MFDCCCCQAISNFFSLSNRRYWLLSGALARWQLALQLPESADEGADSLTPTVPATCAARTPSSLRFSPGPSPISTVIAL